MACNIGDVAYATLALEDGKREYAPGLQPPGQVLAQATVQVAQAAPKAKVPPPPRAAVQQVAAAQCATSQGPAQAPQTVAALGATEVAAPPPEQFNRFQLNVIN